MLRASLPAPSWRKVYAVCQSVYAKCRSPACMHTVLHGNEQTCDMIEEACRRQRQVQPVGAHSASFLPRPFHRSTMYLVVVVLPQPGPPVRIHTGAVAACITACLCPSDSLSSLPACSNIQCLDCLRFACTVSSVRGKWKLCKFAIC